MLFVVTFIAFLQVCFTAALISQNCLHCICEVEGCESEVGKCKMDVGTESCGPFQIKFPYWEDCGRPGGDYHACAMQMSCSEQCVREYLKRYAHKCTRGRTPTCEDYSRVHNGGPEGCEHSDTLSYWKRVKRCCGNDCTATNSASMTSALLAQGAYKKASISIYMLLKILRANKRL